MTFKGFAEVRNGNAYVTDNFGGSIQRGIEAVDDAGTVNIATGTYAGNVDATSTGADKSVTLSPGASPGQVTIMGDLTLDSNDTLDIEIDGLATPPNFDQFIVTGTTTLGNAALDLSFLSLAAVSEELTIIDGSSPIMGEFAGLVDGAMFVVGDTTFMIDYQGGDGNDVVLTVVDVTIPVQSVGVTGDTPTDADNDYTRINNAVQAAPSGATVILEGTFDWTETFANADWVLGSDGLNRHG